jgi:ribosomal protein L11 methyltransferase
MDQHWLQISLTVAAAEAEAVEDALLQLGALSVTLRDAGDEPQFEPQPGCTPLWSSTLVTGLFAAEQDARELLARLARRVPVEAGEAQLDYLKDQAWERVWLDRFQPMRFGRRLWVSPHHHRVTQDGALVVYLDPGLAFGTGTHATTALCLEWLERQDLSGKTLVDFGCGSGILALAAARLGAAQVLALDHDPQAIQATRENARLNQLQQRIEASLSATDPGQPADFLVANILASTLMDLEPLLMQSLKAGGSCALSGVLPEQAEQVAGCYRRMEDKRIWQRDGWVLIEGRKANG